MFLGSHVPRLAELPCKESVEGSIPFGSTKNGIAGFLFGKTRLTHVGYITSSILCGVSSMVECQPSKLNIRVRFPYSALTFKFEKYSNWF